MHLYRRNDPRLATNNGPTTHAIGAAGKPTCPRCGKFSETTAYIFQCDHATLGNEEASSQAPIRNKRENFRRIILQQFTDWPDWNNSVNTDTNTANHPHKWLLCLCGIIPHTWIQDGKFTEHDSKHQCNQINDPTRRTQTQAADYSLENKLKNAQSHYTLWDRISWSKISNILTSILTISLLGARTKRSKLGASTRKFLSAAKVRLKEKMQYNKTQQDIRQFITIKNDNILHDEDINSFHLI